MAHPKRSRRSPRHETRETGDGPWSVSSPTFWAALGAAVTLLLAVATFDPYLFTGGDNVHYYALAKALATGRGYVDLVEPGAPLHVLYPPGFPALLVPFYLVSGGSLVAMKALPWLAAGGLLAGVWILARRDPAVAGWAAAAAVWAVGLYHATQTYSHRLLSDLPYAALVALALAVLQGATDSGADRDRVDRFWIGGSLLAVFAFYVRVVGLTLLGAIGLWAVLTRRWKRAATSIGLFATSLLPGVVPWLLRVRRAPTATGDYLTQFSIFNPLRVDDVDRLLKRLQDVAVEYGTYQLPGMFWPTVTPPDAFRVAGVILAGSLLAWGIVRAVRSRGLAPWDLYALATLAALPIWPWLGDRYMLTLAPFLWLYLLIGLDDVSRRLAGGPAVGVATVGAISAFLLAAHLREVPARWERTRDWLTGEELAGYDPFWEDYFLAALWIGENAPEDAVVLARKPTLTWYWSGRHAIDWPFWESPEEKWRYIRRQGVTHILIEPESARDLIGVLTEHGDKMSMPFHRRRTEVAVFTLAPGPVPSPASGSSAP